MCTKYYRVVPGTISVPVPGRNVLPLGSVGTNRTTLVRCTEHLLATNMSGQRKKFFRLSSKSTIVDSLKSWLPSSNSSSRAPSPPTSRPPSPSWHSTHSQSVDPRVSAPTQEGSSYRGMDSIGSLRQRFNRLTLVTSRRQGLCQDQLERDL